MSDKPFYAEDASDPDTNLTVTATEGGGVSIGVEEEQAYDSYNRRFVCSIHLTAEQANLLATWFRDHFPS